MIYRGWIKYNDGTQLYWSTWYDRKISPKIIVYNVLEQVEQKENIKCIIVDDRVTKRGKVIKLEVINFKKEMAQ